MTYKTVTELAEELNISRQAIQKRIKKLPSEKRPQKIDGKYRLSEEVVREIFDKQKSKEVLTTLSDNHLTTKLSDKTIGKQKSKGVLTTLSDNQATTKLSDDNLDILAIINEDKQKLYKIISNLENRLDESQKLLSQQQQLTLQSNKQIDKLQIRLEAVTTKIELKEESKFNQPKESSDNQEQKLSDLKNELSQKNKENEQLKMEVDKLQEKSKKGFWQRLFNS